MKNYILVIKKDTEFAYIPKEYFLDLFKQNKNWVLLNKYNNEELSFLYNVDVKFFYNIKCDIANLFMPTHLKYLTNKSNLFHTIQKYLPETYDKYMMYHTDVDINNLEQYEKLFIDNKKFILRPTWGFARYGISIFNNFNDFKNFMLNIGKKELNNETDFKKRTNKYNKLVYVLSEFLQNQLLYNNKVFNFRVFYLISLINNKYRSYLILPFVIHLAEKNYNDNLETTSSISSSFAPHLNIYQDNLKLNDFEKKFGKDKYIYVLNSIKFILSKIYKLIKYKKIFKNYDNNNNTYELFGLDFIADNNFNIKLIEINDQVGLNLKYPPVIYQSISSAMINSTINKLYDKEYHIKIDKNIKKNIIRIHSNKKYL